MSLMHCLWAEGQRGSLVASWLHRLLLLLYTLCILGRSSARPRQLWPTSKVKSSALLACLGLLWLLTLTTWRKERQQEQLVLDTTYEVPAIGGEVQYYEISRHGNNRLVVMDTASMPVNYSGTPGGTPPTFYGSEDLQYPLLVDMQQLVTRLSTGLPPPAGVQAINRLRSPWLIGHRDAASGGCSGAEFLLVLVKSHPDNGANRRAIRASWAAADCWHRPVRVFFLVGAGDRGRGGSRRSLHLWNKLADENAQYGDLLVRAFDDDYYNNTLKMMSGIEWAAERCPRARFLAFMDDDFVVSPRPALRYLAAVADSATAYERFIGGWVWRLAEPRRRGRSRTNGDPADDESKWDVSMAEYPWPNYPPYIAAGAMFIAQPVVRSLRIAMQFTRYLRFDDIFIGLVLHKLALTPVHMDAVRSYLPLELNTTDTGALQRLIATHGYRNPRDLQRLWHRLATVTGLRCSTASVKVPVDTGN